MIQVIDSLLWQGTRVAGRLGLTGAGSLAVLAASAALYWGVTVPGQEDLSIARLQHEQALARFTQADRDAAVRGSSAEQVNALLARLPQGGNHAVNDAFVLVQEQAAGHQLVFESTTYQLSADGASGIERYAISLPLKGRYLDVRAFLADVRDRAPHLALDSITFARPSRGDPVLEAQLQLTVCFRKRS